MVGVGVAVGLIFIKRNVKIKVIWEEIDIYAGLGIRDAANDGKEYMIGVGQCEAYYFICRVSGEILRVGRPGEIASWMNGLGGMMPEALVIGIYGDKRVKP